MQKLFEMATIFKWTPFCVENFKRDLFELVGSPSSMNFELNNEAVQKEEQNKEPVEGETNMAFDAGTKDNNCYEQGHKGVIINRHKDELDLVIEVPEPEYGKTIIIDSAGFHHLDTMGVNLLRDLHHEYAAVRVRFVLANCYPTILDRLVQTGLTGTGQHKIDVFPTVQDAVATSIKGMGPVTKRRSSVFEQRYLEASSA